MVGSGGGRESATKAGDSRSLPEDSTMLHWMGTSKAAGGGIVGSSILLAMSKVMVQALNFVRRCPQPKDTSATSNQQCLFTLSKAITLIAVIDDKPPNSYLI